ncbi:thioesterase family protein [Nocardioides sp. LS1]|uniref:acyl-CoA thioesterase n=1 Tax=Nocardioides sp. LS1 TaxID=1027620 RepID=UPI00163B4A00|nr:acyl-CoA thioesterase [Nocardioides sp. LS1]
MNETWSIELPLTEKYVDYLGHVTAAAHLTLLEEAHAHWLASVVDEPEPAFVLVRVELDYERELLLADAPVTVRVEPVELTRSTVTVQEVMASARGPHTRARVVLVRWDRAARRSMPFGEGERRRIDVQMRRPPAG